MDPRWKWFLPGYLWSLPITLIGILLMLPYGAHSFSIRNGLIQCVAKRILFRPAAQTFGVVQFYASDQDRARKDLRVHETGHTWQGFILGPFFILIYPAFFCWHFARQGFSDWKIAYSKNPFEKHCERIRRNDPAWS